MDNLDERRDVCPICRQPIEPDDDVIREGERDVHVACQQEENEIAGCDKLLNRSKRLPIVTKTQKQEVRHGH